MKPLGAEDEERGLKFFLTGVEEVHSRRERRDCHLKSQMRPEFQPLILLIVIKTLNIFYSHEIRVNIENQHP